MYCEENHDSIDRPIGVAAIFSKDNTVTPIAFWTPEDRYIRIDKVLDKQNAATFKTQDIGDRYKIQARNIISYLFRIGDLWYIGHPADDMIIPGVHTRSAGAYYGGRKVIDERYDNPYKIPVDVLASCSADGDVIPEKFWWTDGTMYEIDRVNRWERAASVRAGIIGMRYAIRVRNRAKYLFRDDDLWFMESRNDGISPVIDVHGRLIV